LGKFCGVISVVIVRSKNLCDSETVGGLKSFGVVAVMRVEELSAVERTLLKVDCKSKRAVAIVRDKELLFGRCCGCEK
jgi:hypothetical protein